jgi:hypothetical protein
VKVSRGTMIGFGMAALLLAAAALPVSASTKPAAAKTAAPKAGADKPAAGKATGGKPAAGKPAAGKSATGKSAKDKAAKDKAAAGKDADKDAAAAAPRALAGYPASPAFKSWLADAATDSFYLVLDPRAGTLKLVLGGVEMRSYAVCNIEVATPRRFGSPEPLPENWHERVYTNSVIDPPHPGARTEIVGPEVGTADEKVLVPPTPEEAIPVPSLYRIRFDQGLALELTGGVAEQKGELPPAELPRGFREKVRQLREGYQDPLRLRLQLQPDAYAEIYRMLPPGTDFIILHGGR